MQKINIIPQIVFEILKFLQSDRQRVLRTRFSPDIQSSQNYIAKYGASFKAQKVMLPPLKWQIFHLLSKFVLFTQLSRKQIVTTIVTTISQNLVLHFLVYMAKYPHAKNKEHPLSRSWEKCVTDR